VSVSSTGSQRVKIEQNSVAPLRQIRASALIRHCAGHDRDPAVADQKRLPLRHGQELRFAVDSPLEGGGFELTVPRQGEVTAALASIDVRRGMWHGVRCRG
jgi:hypothetical protein